MQARDLSSPRPARRHKASSSVVAGADCRVASPNLPRPASDECLARNDLSVSVPAGPWGIEGRAPQVPSDGSHAPPSAPRDEDEYRFNRRRRLDLEATG